jgi:branched-chain amino acid transport system permease protein
LAGVVIGGLGSLGGAVWGALLLTFLPNWSDSLGHSFSLPGKVSANLPLAIYGLVLIAAMLVWPSGIQGALRWAAAELWGLFRGPSAALTPAADAAHVAMDEPHVAPDETRTAS